MVPVLEDMEPIINNDTTIIDEGVSMFADGDIWICGTHKTESKLKEKNILLKKFLLLF